MTQAQWTSIEAAGAMQDSLLQATASPYQNFVIKSDFSEVIGDYLRKEAPIWSSIPKFPARGDIVKEITKSSMPTVGFTAKNDLATSPAQAVENRNDFSDPGQQVKAITGLLTYSHYSRSLTTQQNQPYGDQVAIDTTDIIVAACRLVEENLLIGDATANPLSFNGLLNQIPANTATYQNTVTHDLTVPGAERLSSYLPKFVSKIGSSRSISRRVSRILCSGAGLSLIQTEWNDARINLSEVKNTLGTDTVGVLTSEGVVPIVPSRFIRDTSTAGAAFDEVVFWFIDDEQFIWEGVYPYLGEKTFEPQIMDVSSIGPNGQPLTDKRMLIMYGTPYAKNRGRAIHKLIVRCPRGSAWNL
jgi:hypothetical protein